MSSSSINFFYYLSVEYGYRNESDKDNLLKIEKKNMILIVKLLKSLIYNI